MKQVDSTWCIQNTTRENSAVAIRLLGMGLEVIMIPDMGLKNIIAGTSLVLAKVSVLPCMTIILALQLEYKIDLLLDVDQVRHSLPFPLSKQVKHEELFELRSMEISANQRNWTTVVGYQEIEVHRPAEVTSIGFNPFIQDEELHLRHIKPMILV